MEGGAGKEENGKHRDSQAWLIILELAMMWYIIQKFIKETCQLRTKYNTRNAGKLVLRR